MDLPVASWECSKGGFHLLNLELGNSLEFAFRSTIAVDDDSFGLFAVGALVETLQAFKEKLLDSGGEGESGTLETFSSEILKFMIMTLN